MLGDERVPSLTTPTVGLASSTAAISHLPWRTSFRWSSIHRDGALSIVSSYVRKKGPRAKFSKSKDFSIVRKTQRRVAILVTLTTFSEFFWQMIPREHAGVVKYYCVPSKRLLAIFSKTDTNHCWHVRWGYSQGSLTYVYFVSITLQVDNFSSTIDHGKCLPPKPHTHLS